VTPSGLTIRHVMTGKQSIDTWTEGDPYESFVGRWSRLEADDFLAWLALPASLDWLDVGCGTGALTAAILERCQPRCVIGVEPSEGFLARARERLPRGANLLSGDALAIPVDDRSVDVVVSGLVLNFVPDVSKGLGEMRRKTRAGGTVAAYVWDYASGMELMRHFWDVAVELNPAASDLDEGARFPLCRPAALENAFARAGLAAVEVVPIAVSTPFRDFDDYWKPFLGGQGSAPSYVSTLNEEARRTLRDGIRGRLPTRADGSISLVAKAWAVRGKVPE
jgi:SAM-dependent methyltransferase